MFNDSTGTLKSIANILLIVGCSISVICGLALIFWFDGGGLFGFLIIIAGSFYSFISSLLLYAWCELVESIQRIAFNTTTLTDNYLAQTKPSPNQAKQIASTLHHSIAAPNATEETLSQKQTSTSDASNQQQLYIFALQMIARGSYDTAYNALSKINGYRDADELLIALKNKK